jgi:hypothetical protein
LKLLVENPWTWWIQILMAAGNHHIKLISRLPPRRMSHSRFPRGLAAKNLTIGVKNIPLPTQTCPQSVLTQLAILTPKLSTFLRVAMEIGLLLQILLRMRHQKVVFDFILDTQEFNYLDFRHILKALPEAIN